MMNNSHSLKPTLPRLSIGYPVFWGPAREAFMQAARDYSANIQEVYFSWPHHPSGREPTACREREDAQLATKTLLDDLQLLSGTGIRLNLLLNANCYGSRACSPILANEVLGLHDYISQSVPIELITTTSPFIAKSFKSGRPHVRVRASINMRITSVQAMEHVSPYFDEFCIHRDVNRDLARLRQLGQWADGNNKSVSILANSGCLLSCPTGIFHDNWLAHYDTCTAEPIDTHDVLACRMSLKSASNRWHLMAATWIRPEDISQYDALVPLIKLATRTRMRPELIIRAYSKRAFDGNLLELLEPSHLSTSPNWVIHNSRFPTGWFDFVSHCTKDCVHCDYCKTIHEVVSDGATAIAKT